MNEERFSEMRTLLMESPSEEIWWQLTALFDDWEVSDGIEVAIDYANEHLEAGSWPAALRRGPEPWCEVLLGQPKSHIKRKWRRGERAHPAFAICRHISFPYKRNFKPEKIKHLHSADSLSAIEYLEVKSTSIGDDGAMYLAECSHLTSLKGLLLSHNEIGPQGIWDLVETDFLAGLIQLDIRNPIGDEGIKGLVQCEHLASLEHLGISQTGISPKSAKWLAESPYLTQLTSLDLSDGGWQFSPRVMRELSGAPFLSQLTYLNIAGSDDIGGFIDAIVKFPLTALRELDISRTRLSADSAERLISCDALQQLERLHCAYVDEDVQERLRAHFQGVLTTDYHSSRWV